MVATASAKAPIVLCTLLALTATVAAAGLYSLEVYDILGTNVVMDRYFGNVTLVVNVASE